MAKYKGKSVRLGKPSRIRKGQPGYGRKKSQVYVKSGSKIKRVTFGDPKMRIKKNVKPIFINNKVSLKCMFPKSFISFFPCEKYCFFHQEQTKKCNSILRKQEEVHSFYLT